MRTSTLTGKLMLAIRAVQKAKPLAAKSGTVKMGEGQQARVEKFAPHDEIWEDLQPICDANGLTVTQGSGVGPNGCALLITRITWANDDGTEEQWIEGDLPVVPQRPGFRDFGAPWSYCRRIMLLSFFGIVAGGDEPDQAEADKLKLVKPPRDDGQRPHMAPVDSEAIATRLLADLDALPPGSPLAMVEELSKQFKDLALSEATDIKVRDAFKAKREALGLPPKLQAKRKP
jgi:hypothetical protein